MLSWSSQRQLIYLLSIVGTLLLLGAYPLFKVFYVAPSCTDGKQNQEEVGIDCGGPCNALCGSQVKDIAVGWSEAFKVGEGIYDLATIIENPNLGAGVGSISYTFKVYDKRNALIANRSGKTFINPLDKFVIFESDVRVGERVPVKVTFALEENPRWMKAERIENPIVVKNKKLLNTDTSPRLTATLANSSIDSISDIGVTAVIYDNDGNSVAASATFESFLEKNSSKNIFFTWVRPFTTRPKGGVCTAPADAILVFDRSGSMDDDGLSPPQPLTDAKNAALVFAQNVQSVDQVGLVSFATTASDPIDQVLTLDRGTIQESIKNIKIFGGSIQHTNLGDAIARAKAELTGRRHNAEARKAMVILTDGIASRPLDPEGKDQGYPETYARERAAEAQDSNISIYVIGLGGSVNEGFLKNDISSTPEHYYKATTSVGLRGIYDEIAQVVCEEETFITDIFVHVKE
ncbi:MAG: hypothetical protein BMS9Abin13_426 [Patescibacteria group bacterium]|nr:MAG: hypothetical protein BMS9Abin13_426 [Patescibacteria group bacterium]